MRREIGRFAGPPGRNAALRASFASGTRHPRRGRGCRVTVGVYSSSRSPSSSCGLLFCPSALSILSIIRRPTCIMCTSAPARLVLSSRSRSGLFCLFPVGAGPCPAAPFRFGLRRASGLFACAVSPSSSVPASREQPCVLTPSCVRSRFCAASSR